MMEPLISLMFQSDRTVYQPGEELACEYQIDAVDVADLQAVEASVLWHTDGKGDVDMAVHYFERRTPADVTDGDLRELRRFSTRLPNSPLSYSGEIVKIRWCVRVRVFLRGGKECFFERPFQLGDAPGAGSLTSGQSGCR